MALSHLDQICFVLGVIAATPVVTVLFNARSLRKYAERQETDRHEAKGVERIATATRHAPARIAVSREHGAQERRLVQALHADARSLASARSVAGRRALALTGSSGAGTETGPREREVPRRHGRITRDRYVLAPPSRRHQTLLRPPTVAPPPGPSTQPSRAPLPKPAPPPQPTSAPQTDAPAKDRTVRYLALFAAGISVAATAYFYHRGQLVLYDDEFSRMSISRRIFDNPSGFSLAQLGGVWLPWPQLQMMPFVALNSLYFDGLGGSIPSMLSFVACSVLVYKIVYRLTARRRAPAIAAAAVFMLNPNVLYMQSTALSELGMFLWLLGGVYGVQRFFEVEQPSAQRRYIALAGISCTLALLTRYEGWIVTAGLLACVLYGCARRGGTGAQVRAWALSFAFFPALALLGWLAYNQVIFGSALYFYDGPYAKPSLWSSASDPAVGNWLVSAKTYLYAVLDDTNWPTVALGLAGILALAFKRRLASHTLPALSLLLLIPFFVWSLHGAQRPMHVEQINHSLYNTRFALVYAPAAAIYIGCLIGALMRTPAIRIASATAIVAAVAAMALSFASPDTRITTLEDNFAWSRQPVATQFASAASYLRAHYHHGLVLAQFFGSEGVLYEAHITPGVDVYEGIHRLWLPAIANPVRAGIRWVVMRTDPIDLVYRSLHDSRRLLENYDLVYDRSEYQIYERRGCGVRGC